MPVAKCAKKTHEKKEDSCHKVNPCNNHPDISKLAVEITKLLVEQNFTELVKYLSPNVVISFTDPTNIIPYSGNYFGLAAVQEFFSLLSSYVIPISNDIHEPFVQKKDSDHHVIVTVDLKQQNRQTAFGAPQVKPFDITESIEYTFDSKGKVTEIKILSNSTALVLFYQFPVTNGPIYNNYKLLLTVGQDEDLPSPGYIIGDPALPYFTSIFGLTPSQIENLRLAAIAWFKERFGLDFSDMFPIGGGFYTNGKAIMYPIYADVNYRIYQSTSTQIPILNTNDPPKVHLAEWVVGFTGFPAPVYFGTYGIGAGADGAQGFTGDALAYGIYQVNVNADIYGPARKFKFYMRSYLPGRGDPYPEESNGAPQINPTFTIENFQFYSPEFGPGFAHLIAIVASTPNDQGKYPTRYRATYSFPGSFAYPQLNGYTTPPNL